MDRKVTRGLLASFLLKLIKSDPIALIVVFILSLVAAISQAGIFFIIFKLLQPGIESLNIFGKEINDITLWSTIIIFAVGAAFAPYTAERFIIKKTINLFKTSLHNFANYLTRAEDRNYLLRNGFSVAELTRLMSSETRYASLAYSSLLRSVFPLAAVVIFLGMMFWLNWLWTTIIVAAFFPFVIWQFLVLVSGIQINRDLRESASAHSRYVSQFIGSLSNHFTSNRWGDSLTTDFDNFVTGKYPDTYKDRLKLGVSLRVIGDLSIVGVILAVAFLTFTKRIGITEISYVLVFALLVRFVHSNVDRIMKNLIGIITQQPFYSLYITTMPLLSRDKREEQEQITTKFESGISVVFTNRQINWGVAGQYVASRFEAKHQESIVKQSVLLTSRFGMIKSDFVSSFQLSRNFTETHFRRMFPESSNRWPAFEKMLKDTKGELNTEKWRSIPAVIKFLCSANYALKRNLEGKIAFVNGLDLNALTKEEVEWLFKELNPAMVVVFYSNPMIYRTTPNNTTFSHLTPMGKLITVPVNEDTGYPDLSDLKHFFDLDKLQSQTQVFYNEDLTD